MRKSIDDFLSELKLTNIDVVPLTSDASFRRYFRIHEKDKTSILMDAPPLKENVRPFIKITNFLSKNGFNSPQIYAEDTENGFLLLEDLGDETYTKILNVNDNKEEELYSAAIKVLSELHKQKTLPDVPVYSQELLNKEAGLFLEWHLNSTNRIPESNAEIFFEILNDLYNKLTLPKALVLRDYHADNLMWLNNKNAVGLLDFQDAVLGSPAYDLASLLEDARRDVKPKTVKDSINLYLSLSNIDPKQFMLEYAILAAQRNIKIIGIFNRLAKRDGKSGYLSFLPRVWNHLFYDLENENLKHLKDWILKNGNTPK